MSLDHAHTISRNTRWAEYHTTAECSVVLTPKKSDRGPCRSTSRVSGTPRKARPKLASWRRAPRAKLRFWFGERSAAEPSANGCSVRYPHCFTWVLSIDGSENPQTAPSRCLTREHHYVRVRLELKVLIHCRKTQWIDAVACIDSLSPETWLLFSGQSPQIPDCQVSLVARQICSNGLLL